MPKDTWFILLLLLLPTVTTALAAAVVPPKIQTVILHPHNTADLQGLAELRYQEWMVVPSLETATQDNTDDANSKDDSSVQESSSSETTQSTTPPSRYAFGRATADITQERTAQGAVTLLAKLADGVVVGSAELSPIEFQDVSGNNNYLYVTDVVTSSHYRRQGIATAVMEAVEEHACAVLDSPKLFLHVDAPNVGALTFYRHRGYTQVENVHTEIDTTKLAQNAGTVGQVLLVKALPRKTRRNRTQGGRGFG